MRFSAGSVLLVIASWNLGVRFTAHGFNGMIIGVGEKRSILCYVSPRSGENIAWLFLGRLVTASFDYVIYRLALFWQSQGTFFLKKNLRHISSIEMLWLWTDLTTDTPSLLCGIVLITANLAEPGNCLDNPQRIIT